MPSRSVSLLIVLSYFGEIGLQSHKAEYLSRPHTSAGTFPNIKGVVFLGKVGKGGCRKLRVPFVVIGVGERGLLWTLVLGLGGRDMFGH